MKFDNYKFRPHTLSTLISARGGLTQTAKSKLDQIWLTEMFGIQAEPLSWSNLAVKKGIECENDSISIWSEVKQTFCQKNTQRVENEWLTGEADLVFEDNIVDIKTAYSIQTFMSLEEGKVMSSYYWQIIGYLWLYDKKYGSVDYVLTDHSPELLMLEAKKRGWYGADETLRLEIEAQMDKQFTYPQIPVEDKVKSFLIKPDNLEGEIKKIVKTLEQARDYLNNKKL